MAKFCLSGKDEVTGQFYYCCTWRTYSHVKGSIMCLCGFDVELFIEYMAWYQANGTKYEISLPVEIILN